MSERSYLEEISIRNLGIIDSSSLELSKGLNVLTGETGAGKTMILTALSLLLGSKSDSALVRHGSERLVASATFQFRSHSNLRLKNVVGLSKMDHLFSHVQSTATAKVRRLHPGQR